MTIFHADNDDAKTDFSLQRDTYPYVKRDSLTDHSMPEAILYTPNLAGSKYMGKPITSIKRNADQTVSFHFGGTNTNGISTIEENNIPRRMKVYHIAGKDIWVTLQKNRRTKYIE